MDRALTSSLRPDGLSIGQTYDSAGRADITTIPGGAVDHCRTSGIMRCDTDRLRQMSMQQLARRGGLEPSNK